MAIEMDALAWLRLASTVLIMLFGFFVGWVNRFRGPNLAFMLLEAGWGLALSCGTLLGGLAMDAAAGGGPPLVYYLLVSIELLAVVAGVLGAALIAARFPTGQRTPPWLMASVVVVAAGFGYAFARLSWSQPFDVDFRPWWQVTTIVTGFLGATSALMLGIVVVLAGKYPALHASSRRAAAQAALVASALAMYPATLWAFLAYRPFGTAQGPGEAAALIGFAVAAIVGQSIAAALWLRASWRSGEDAVARHVGLWIAFTGLVAMAWAVFGPAAPPSTWARFIAVLILSYAIVRHQLHGIELKVRWTISKSTMAGIFIAVYFVVSEASVEFLGTRTNSTYLGIVAAGMLLFAISPIQRVVDRLATRAIPVAGADAATSRVYMDLAKRLVADGDLSDRDRTRLAGLADQLGLSNQEAARITNEAQRSKTTRP